MTLIKMKPTSPGTRFVVKVDRSHLHKGGPIESLTTKKTVSYTHLDVYKRQNDHWSGWPQVRHDPCIH